MLCKKIRHHCIFYILNLVSEYIQSTEINLEMCYYLIELKRFTVFMATVLTIKIFDEMNVRKSNRKLFTII